MKWATLAELIVQGRLCAGCSNPSDHDGSVLCSVPFPRMHQLRHLSFWSERVFDTISASGMLSTLSTTLTQGVMSSWQSKSAFNLFCYMCMNCLVAMLAVVYWLELARFRVPVVTIATCNISFCNEIQKWSGILVLAHPGCPGIWTNMYWCQFMSSA